MRIAIFVWVVFTGFACSGQSAKFPLQEIIDSVYVSESGAESFAMYLPAAYQPDAYTSVVLIFDPMGRGNIGISPFIKAAETYNHVLICSNQARNGPYERNFQITSRLLDKVFSDFKIDQNRIYTAGFSGGARLAASIAIKTQMIQGVLACGAGMSSNDLLFQKNWDFSYAAIVGDRDMNLLEMINTQDYADKLNVSNELFVYDMRHQWPSKEQVLEAFDWLELEANRKGVVQQNQSRVEELYSKFLIKAKMLENENQLVSALNEYQRLIDNFSLYLPMDSIINKMMSLRESTALKSQKKEREKYFQKERSLTEVFFERFYDDLGKNNQNLKWWEKRIENLKNENQSDEGEEGKMLDRLLYSIYALAIENVTIEGVDNLNQAVFCYDICIQIYPEHYILYFNQIDNCLQLGKEDQAMVYLEKLILAGYQDIQEIRTNSLFDPIRTNKRFEELIN